MIPNDRSPLADTEVHHLRSEHVGDDFKIFVGDCAAQNGGDATGEPLVPLYVSDANGNFGAAVDLVRYMRLNLWLPPMLVVGVGYPVGILGETIPLRNRDLTPTRDDDWSTTYADGGITGGAPQFLAFLRDELQPWVEARYRVDPARATFSGHSSGGLFASWVLLTAPNTFANYAVASPSLWWDHDMMFGVEEAYARSHDDLPANVFVANGEWEDQSGRERALSRLAPEEQAKSRDRHIDFVADSARMVATLRSRNYRSLRIENVVLPEESHNTVPHLALSRALRWLFDAPR